MRYFPIIVILILHTSIPFVVRAQQNHIHSYTIQDGLVNNDILNIYQDSQGNFWIGTFNGVVRIDKNGIAYRYTQQDGLPGSFVNCIKEDIQHNIWIGTTQGLAKFSLNNGLNSFSLRVGYPGRCI